MDLYFRIGIKRMSKTLIASAVMLALAFGMTACEKKTTSEKVSGAAQDAGKAVNDAGKATGKAVDDAAKATGKAAEDATK